MFETESIQKTFSHLVVAQEGPQCEVVQPKSCHVAAFSVSGVNDWAVYIPTNVWAMAKKKSRMLTAGRRLEVT
jgi:hypothetical protein